MFIKKSNYEFLVAQVYMDNIVFEGHPNSLILTFVEQMKTKFKMSIVGKLTFFLGFQIHKKETRIFL